MGIRVRRWLALVGVGLLSLTLSAGSAGAAEPAPTPLPAPAGSSWTRQETTLLGLGLVATGLAFGYDEDLQRLAARNGGATVDHVAKGFSLLGHPLVEAGVAGALWGMGKLRNDPALTETGALAAEAVVWAELVTLGLKEAVGRQRPGTESDHFRPFSLHGFNDSFPSGHTSGAFALAAVLARRSSGGLAPWGYYGVAGLVGLSRIYRNEHWASDVVGGAVLGELCGRLVLANQKQQSLRLGLSLEQGRPLVLLTAVW